MPQKTPNLNTREATEEFYEAKYSDGYNQLEVNSPWKRERIFDIIRSLDLPKTGKALDFGCGRGGITDIIRRALPPGWNVYGTEISAIAVEDARKSYPECTFFQANDRESLKKRCDFIFTHHVLEHVYDLPVVLDEINGLLKDKAGILHILPCGNEGSLEHNICLHRKDGINRHFGNRFFFEGDEGHLRRLTSEQLIKYYEERGFSLATEYYSHQYEGAIEWFTMPTCSYTFIRFLTDPSQAINPSAKKQLKRLRLKLLAIWTIRYFVALFEKKLNKEVKRLKDYLHLICGFPIYLLSKPVDWHRKFLAQKEWQSRKKDRNGSEMYLFFKKTRMGA